MPPIPEFQRPQGNRRVLRPATAAVQPTGGVFDRIRPIGFGPDYGIKLFLYGESGTGKTTFWATFPDPILALICSGGNNPGELLSVDTEENKDRIKTVTIETPAELSEVCDRLKDDTYFKTIVLDHVSGYQDLVLASILGLEEIPVQKEWGMAKKEEYGGCALQCKVILRRMLNLKHNMIWVAHEKVFKPDDKDSEVISTFVAGNMMPQLSRWVNAAMDNICQMYRRNVVVTDIFDTGEVDEEGKPITQEVATTTKDVEYVLRMEESSIFASKLRMDRRRKRQNIVDPDYAKFIAQLRG